MLSSIFALRGLSFLIFTENKEGVRAIRAIKYKKRGWKIYSRTRTFGVEVHKSNIRVKRWHNKYENSELDLKTHLSFKWFAYQVQSYWTNFWDTLWSQFFQSITLYNWYLNSKSHIPDVHELWPPNMLLDLLVQLFPSSFCTGIELNC